MLGDPVVPVRSSEARPAAGPSASIGWLVPPLMLGAIALAVWLIVRGPDGLFGIALGGVIGLGLLWILISSLLPGKADRRCERCGAEALERMSPDSTSGIRCASCGFEDETASAWLLAEEEGPLEATVLRQRAELRAARRSRPTPPKRSRADAGATMTDSPQDPRMIGVRLQRIVYRTQGDRQYIHLREEGGERCFPIVIGTPEANEIHRVVTNQEMARPMTHKLAHNLIEALGHRLAKVDIVDLRDNTFHARLVITNEAGDRLVALDARPSDAIALALRAGCPIRVAEDVLEQVRTDNAQDELEEPEDAEDSGESEGPEEESGEA